MKLDQKVTLILLTAGMAVLAWKGNAQTPDEQIQVARSAVKADRKATVAGALQFTEQEGKAFWPLYDQYRAETDKLGDALLKLMKDYAQLYPNVPDDRAKVILKELGGLEKQLVGTRNSYLNKIVKVIPPSKALRFAQVESRLDLALRLGIASEIPLVPIEGRLAGETGSAASVTEGVPGGSAVQTYELEATVAALDKATRKITLVDAAGIKTTVKAGPEVVNFDQIQLGDKLKLTAAQELVVSLAGEGETPSDGGTQLVALAPKGAKPGGMMVETTQITATVTALNAERHKATLQFEDGTTHTVAVRPDVDLSKRKVGEKVVIRVTESLAIRVAKP
jgi:hypothetical protein